jgi:predicted HicB family RNase H-like nuclease
MAKKSFRGTNPALQYISSIELESEVTHNAQDTHNAAIMHKTHNVPMKETKSRRLNLLLQPSLLENMSKVARMKQTSVNDLINKVLKDYTERETTTIARYDEVFGSPSVEATTEVV